MSSTELDLDALTANSSRAKREVDHLRDMLAAASDALDYLQGLTPRQAAALREDAARYRKLRNASMDERNRLEHYAGPALDEALDALPAATQGK